MSYTNVAPVVSMLQEAYPKAKDVWIRRAAQDLIAWFAKNTKPTKEQIDAQDERVRVMCTKGKWYS